MGPFILWAPTLRAQAVEVYKQIEVKIDARASSCYKGRLARSAVNGEGMKGEMHVSNNGGEGMWLSAESTNMLRYAASTQQGKVWFLCEAPELMTVDQIRIWNYNQNEHIRRGLHKVYIEYSADGKNWTLIKAGLKDYHVIPMSVGKNPEPADFYLNLNGIKAKYICLTAADNYYDRSNPVMMREAEDMHQNVDYYGLSEIRFYQKVMATELPKVQKMSLEASQAYLRTKEGPVREFFIGFEQPLFAGARLTFSLGDKKWEDTLQASPVGVYRYTGHFPVGYMEESADLTVRMEGLQGKTELHLEVPAARKWEVAFMPHSHQDIGYTHRQADVMRLQWRNLERAMDLAQRTKDYPQGARYCWNTEATWAIIAYLEEYAGTPKAQKMIEAIQEGVINVDATVGSILTGICRQEELLHMFDDAHRLAEMTGVEMNTAMMSDVPGQVWGLATAMADNGVKYYSPGPNYVPFYGKIGNDRAAALHTEWGDRPFWWESQAGTDKVMVWQAGRGYSWFHGWLAGSLSVCGTEPLWAYLQELELDEFPYDMCYLRYTVHGDNGPPDQQMPDIIRAWNERYEYPKFSISTSKAFFTAFAQRYEGQLPTYKGDMTPTWEDGAASTARETAMNRESSARLAQSSILWSMISEEKYPVEAFHEAWKNVLLFSEHTWGAAGSGPEPDSKFTKDLWAGKKMYADSADRQSRHLRNQAVAALTAHNQAEKALWAKGSYLHVINTNLWKRTDVVEVEEDLSGCRLVDAKGEAVPIQRLHNGRWIFLAKEVPALSSAVYKIEKGALPRRMSGIAEGYVLDNGRVRVELNPESGTIVSLTQMGSDFNYAGGQGLNAYLYTERIGANPVDGRRPISVQVWEDGPVAATLRVESEEAGCHKLYRDVTVYPGLERVDIVNTVDKEDIRKFENVRFVFPFNFPHPEISLDLAMSEVHPEREQLAGVNKHYYSLQNGLSIGDLEHGICLTSIDAPFVEFGSTSGEDYRLNPRYGYGWWLSSQISPVVYSWVMTNTWRTNYKASQGGVAVFRYALQPGDPFDLKLKQLGLDREQPLQVVRSRQAEKVPQLFRLSGRNKIALSGMYPSKDGKGYIIKLQNMSKQVALSSFIWGSLEAKEAWVCDQREICTEPFEPASFCLQPYEYKIIKIITK